MLPHVVHLPLDRTRDAEALQRVIDAERPAGEPPGSAWIQAAAELAARWQASGRSDRVWPLLRGVEPLLPGLEARDPASAARVHRVLATQGLLAGDPGAFLDRSRLAEAAFERAGEVREACVERARVGHGAMLLGAHEEAERALRTAIAEADREGIARAAAGARHDLARVLARRGRIDEARALEEEAVRASVELGDAHLEAAARAHLALVHLLAGDARAGEVEARRAIDAAAPPHARAVATLAEALRAVGRAAEAREAADRAIADLDAIDGFVDGETFVRLARAEALRAAGARAASAAAVQEARRRMLGDASRIESLALRRSFLEEIPENRRVLELAARGASEDGERARPDGGAPV